MKRDKVVSGDAGDGRGCALSAEWVVGAVEQLSELAAGNPCRVVISPADCLQCLVLRPLQFGRIKGWSAYEIGKDREAKGKILLQAI